MIAKTALKNIRYRPLNTALSLVLLTASVAIISLLLLLQNQFEKKFSDNIDGIDLVLGAKGSPLQLILSSVYQMDAPTGNIPLDSAQVWMKNPFVQSAIPLSFGDNYRGFKIVGTTPEYSQKYGATLLSGTMFQKDFEVVVGNAIAEKLGLKVGQKFLGSHGDVEGGEVHEDHPYVITGILKPTGKVIDNLILSNLSSVWAVHGSHDHSEEVTDDHVHSEACNHEHEHSDAHDHNHSDQSSETAHAQPETREITAVLLKMRNKMALVTWPRLIAANTNMQVASPAVEVNRLFTLFGVGIQALQYLAYGIMLISGISIFIALYNTLKERKYEFALMRISGAGRFHLLKLIVFESLFLCVIGFVFGIISGRIALYVISGIASDEYKMTFSPLEVLWEEEGLLFLLTIFTGFIAALVPAIKAYSLNISKTLANA